jgi:hypothetical protein
MRLSFEVRIEKLELVKCETIASQLRRWLAKLWKLLINWTLANFPDWVYNCSN